MSSPFLHGVAEQNENAGWIWRFIFLFLKVNQGMKEGGESKIFLCHPRALGASSQNFYEWGYVIVYYMCVCMCKVFVDD